MSRKVYVELITKYSPEGKITPVELIWEDGRHYPIDKVLDVRRAASLKAGGVGIRYTVRIQNKETFLWLEEQKWFVEGK